MNTNEHLTIDRHLNRAIELLDRASDELMDARPNKEARFFNGALIKLEQRILELRADVQALNEMRKEIKYVQK